MRVFSSRVAASAALLFLAACNAQELANPTPIALPESSVPTARFALVATAGLTAQVKTKLPSARCWDAGGSTRISLRDCDNAAGYQLVTLQANGDMKLGNSCLVAWGDTGADGSALTAYGCGGPISKWTFTSAEEIRSSNNKCLQASGAGDAGDLVVLMPCTGAVNQKWSNAAGTTPAGAPVASVAVTVAASSVAAGGQTQATAVVRDANNNTLTDRTTVWSSSSNAVATVSNTGLVSAVAAGSAVITATTEGKSGAANVTVTSSGTTNALVTGVSAQMKTQLPSALCWDAGSSTRVTLRACDGAAGYQLVTLQTNGDMKMGNSCLVAWGDTGADGSALTAYGCGGPISKWTYTANAEIRSTNDKCLQAQNVGNAGELVVLMPCTGATNQKWRNAAGSTTPVPPAPTAASVSVTLAAGSVVAPAQTQATAVVRDANNNVLTGGTTVWSSSNASVATVSSAGVVSGVAAGSANITATVDGKVGSATITVSNAPSGGGTPSGYFIATNGSSSGDGSINHPWDIVTALAHPAKVKGGDTLWIRGGTYKGEYTSQLHGTAGSPVVVRQYPGERATIDGGVAVRGAYSWFWGFEVMNSDLGALVTAVDVYGAGTKIINMIVHDAAGNGIGLWEGASDAELNGNVLYNVGRAGSSAGRYAHGIYFQNVTTTKRLIDNVVLNSYSYNFHGYTEGAGLNNLFLEGNVSFNAGSFVSYGGAEYLVGGDQPVRNLTFNNNFSYRGGGLTARNEFGYNAPTPVGNSVTNNYLAGATKFSYLDGLTFTGNTLVNASREMIEIYQNSNQSLGSGYVFSNNVYRAPNARDIAAFRRVVGTGTGYSFAEWQAFGYDRNSDFQIAAATGTKTAVRANQYEKGRANIVVYNWDHLGQVSVDLSSVLSPGDRYEVREVQDYYGAVVLSGTFGGGSISLPMTAVTAVRPLGAINTAAPSTGTEFHTFVVIRKP